MAAEHTNHYALTKKQYTILNVLYRFRFATSNQFSTTLNINKNTINKRLKLMTDLKYIGRRYEPEDRISRKYASYYLLPDGIAELRKISKQKYLAKVLRNIRHDTEAKDPFVQHSLAVFDIYRMLRASYGDNLQFFTKTQMASKPYFPKKLPDAHLQLGKDDPKLFLLELLHNGQPFFLATRAFMRYIDYADKDIWPSQFAFPKILLVCDSLALQKRLLKKMAHRIDTLDNPKLRFFITTLDQLKNDEWRDMAHPDESLSLSQI